MNHRKRCQVTAVECNDEDYADLNEAETDLEHPNVNITLKEILKRMDVQDYEIQVLRNDMNSMRNEMNAQVDVTRREIKQINYRICVLENQRFSETGQNSQIVPFIFGNGPSDALPRINNIFDIDEMDQNDIVTYIHGYYSGKMPATLLNKKKKLAELVGLGIHKVSLR